MLSARILNSDATLNNFIDIGALEFIPGAQIKLVLQIYQTQKGDDLRYVVEDPLGTVTVTLTKTDGTTLSKALTAFDQDRSIWYVDLEESETEDLVGGNFTFEIDELGDATILRKGWVQNGISNIITGAC